METMTIEQVKDIRMELITTLINNHLTIKYVEFSGEIVERVFSLDPNLQKEACESFSRWEASLSREERAARRLAKEEKIKWDDMLLHDQIVTIMLVDVEGKRWRKVNIPYILRASHLKH